MNLQLLRGRDLRPPSRHERTSSAAVSETPIQSNISPTPIEAPARKKALRFPVNPATRAFYRRFYPDTTTAEWNDWRWQLRTRIRTLADLSRVFTLSKDEHDAVAGHTGSLPVGITPYYASLMGLDDPTEPLRRTHVMVGDEYVRLPGEEDDPLGEDHDTVVPGLVHRYPDRVLFLTTGTCSTYCRYCTRSRLVGNPGGEYNFNVRNWELALKYLEEHTEVRDVLLSGGDPLTIGDDKLDYLLGRLRAIKHIEFLRIGSKIPTVLPQRITKDLVKVLKKHHPLWMSLHFTHPKELTSEVSDVDRASRGCGHPARVADRAAQGHQRRSRRDEAPDAWSPDAPGEAVLPLSVRSDQRLGPFPPLGRCRAQDHPRAPWPHHRLPRRRCS
jgi:lysine 2,3-aminomutase